MDNSKETDVGNGQAFVETNKGLVLFDRASRNWLTWNGMKWESGDEGAIELAKATAHRLLKEANGTSGLESVLRERWAIKSMSATRIRAMLELAHADPRIAAKTDDFDSRPDVLNTPSGIVDLRTGRLAPHDPALLQRQVAAVPYSPDATCPIWDASLLRAMGGDKELVAFLQRSIGYAATGETGEQCFFLFIGLGGSGKSTTMEMVARVLGTYARSASVSSLVKLNFARSGADPELYGVVGARFVYTSELEGGARLDEARLRWLTGGERVSIRNLWRETEQIQPRLKLFLAANDTPRISENHDGTWRRVRLVRWDEQLLDDRDVNFLRKLETEAEGILAWIVRGAVAYYREGLELPAVAREWIAEYRASQDDISAFLSAVSTVRPGAWVGSTELHQRFLKWAIEQGRPEMSQKEFGGKLAVHLAKKRDPRTGRWGYRDRALLTSA